MTRDCICFLVCLLAALDAQAGLVIHWKLDEPSGATTVADSSGHGRTGTVGVPSSTAFYPLDGILGGAARFNNAVSESVFVKPPGVVNYPFTISLWIKNSTTANDTVAVLGTGNNSIYHSLHRSGNLIERNPTSFLNPAISAASVPVSNNQWHHIVGVWVGETSRSLYVDGLFIGTSTAQGANHNTATGGVLPDRFAIGALNRSDSSVVDNYDGFADDASLWDEAFDAPKAAALHALGRFQQGGADQVNAFLAAYAAQENVDVNGNTWVYVTDLTGGLGATGGSVAGNDAYVVLDASGTGMRLGGVSGAPLILSFAANLPQIYAGDPVTLTWNVTRADGVSIDPDLGAVAPAGT